MFLIRMTFWLSLVIAFIPANPDDLNTDQRIVSTQETIGVVQTTVSDFARFCERNGETCETGKELFSQFGAKAKTGVRFVYNFIDGENESIAGQHNRDSIQTGSTPES